MKAKNTGVPPKSDTPNNKDTRGYADTRETPKEQPRQQQRQPQAQNQQQPKVQQRQQQPKVQQRQQQPQLQAPSTTNNNQQARTQVPEATNTPQVRQNLQNKQVQRPNNGVRQVNNQQNRQIQSPQNKVPQVSNPKNNPVQQPIKKGLFSRFKKGHVPKVKKPMTVKKAVVCTAFTMSLIFGAGCGAYYYSSVYTPPAIVKAYESSGLKPLDVLEKSLLGYNISDLNNQISSEKSWISQELEYANGSKIRNNFIQKVLANIKFEYPTMQAENKRGLMFDKAGNPVMVKSDMTHGEKVAVTHIDYNALANNFQDNKDEILKLVATHGYSKTDYFYKDEMIDTMIEYIGSVKELPLTTDEIKIPLENKPDITTDAKGKEVSTDHYYIKDDADLDKLLFSTEEFHRMCDSFAMVITGWKPTITQQEQDNPEYAKYQRGIAEGTITANATVPEKKIMVNVVTGDAFPSEQIIPYTWIGAYYLQHEYKNGNTIVLPQVGNGTIDRPAGVNTVVLTKAIDTSGYAHDIKLTLTGIWREQDAINYLSKFSEQNRGISNTADVKMLCAEFSVQNLTNAPITIKEDMALCDKSGNLSSKTGLIYGLTDTLTLAPNESKTIQAWTSSTDLDRKYLIWGRSYNKQFSPTWFKVLAGDKDSEANKAKNEDTSKEK